MPLTIFLLLSPSLLAIAKWIESGDLESYGPIDSTAIGRFRKGKWEDADVATKKKFIFVSMDLIPVLISFLGERKTKYSHNLLASFIDRTTEAFAWWVLHCYNYKWEEEAAEDANRGDEPKKKKVKSGVHKSKEAAPVWEAYNVLLNEIRTEPNNTAVGAGWDKGLKLAATLRAEQALNDRNANLINSEELENTTTQNPIKLTDIVDLTGV